MSNTFFTGEQEVRRGLEHPLGRRRLFQEAGGHYYLTILTGGLEEGLPARQIIPSILDELLSTGVEPDCLSIIIDGADGRPHTHDELAGLLGPKVAAFLRTMDVDSQKMTAVGEEAALFYEAAQASFRIVLSLTRPGEGSGTLRRLRALGSPAFAALPEDSVLSLCPPDFAITVALNDAGEIIRCFCGDFRQAEQACLDSLMQQ